MKRCIFLTVAIILLVVAFDLDVLGQRGGGRGGGGRAGGARAAGGRAGGVSPSFSRPSGGGGGGRPNFGAGSGRPGMGPGGGGGNRVGGGGLSGPGGVGGNRPGGGLDRPGPGGGGVNRPGSVGGNRPGGGLDRPGPGGGALNRPGGGVGIGGGNGGLNRPGGGASTLPARPGAGGIGDTRPSGGFGIGGGNGGLNRPGGGASTLPVRPGPGGDNRPGGGFGIGGGSGGGGATRPGGGPDRPGLGDGGLIRPGSPGTGGGGNINRPNLDLGNRLTSNQFNSARWSQYNQHWAVGYRAAWVRPGNWYRPWYAGRPLWYWSQPWYWYHWRWHYGYWVYADLASVWLGAASGALASPGDSFVYNNPYYSEPANVSVEVPVTINYSEPIPSPGGDQAAIAYPPAPSTEEGEEGQALPTSEPPAPPTDDPAVSAANEQFEAARKSFKDGQYVRAQELTEKAIQALPSDATLHEFRALTQFAQKKYKEAAATLYAVLAAGPGWDRKTMRGLYPDWDTYMGQFQDLEGYVKNHPDDGSAHFLLAYHHLVNGNPDQAVSQLKDVVRLVPKDQLSAAMLKALSANDK